MSTHTERLEVRLNKTQLSDLKQWVRLTDINLSTHVRRAIKRYLAEEKRQAEFIKSLDKAPI